MPRKVVRRKPNTALVFNPSGGLSIRSNGRSRPARRKARANPTARRPSLTASAKTNPRRRRRRRNPSGLAGLIRNPASSGGLIVTAFMVGVSVSLFDAITQRVIPQTSPLVRVGTKLAGALFFQSAYGSKVPILGKYKNEAALVLGVAAMVDLTKLYILPAILPVWNQVAGGALSLLPAPPAAGQPAANGGTLGNIGRPVSYIY